MHVCVSCVPWSAANITVLWHAVTLHPAAELCSSWQVDGPDECQLMPLMDVKCHIIQLVRLPKRLLCAQVEEAALSKEKDKASQERLDDVRKEVAALQDELQPLLSRYNKERARLQELRRLRKKREDLQVGRRSCSWLLCLFICYWHSMTRANGEQSRSEAADLSAYHRYSH